MLGRQWEARLKLWKDNLEKRYVRPISELSMEYFTTMDQLSFEEAEKGQYVPAPEGTSWGLKWQYGWFRTSFDISEELSGKRVVMHLGTAEEMLVFVNGRESGSIDKKHEFITISRNAVTGTHYDVWAECYAGHGKRVEDCGPCGPGEEPVPEVTSAQIKTKKSYLAIWEEEIFQVSMDYMALYELAFSLPETSLRRMKIIEGLKKFTYIADFELEHDEMVKSIMEADKVLVPLLQCKNGSTAPEFSIFGQSHIDLAWLWPEEETKRKAARTYSTQLELMEEYPEFKFFLCSPTVLEYDKKYYPELYKRIQKANEEGKFIPEGAMWIESDTNIPGGESLIRQFVRGKRWFENEMNANSRLAWMPDTFGFNGQLPQIMKKCGVDYFATQKLLRADPECEQFPYNIFWWEGIDGTKILSHIYKKNNSQFSPAHLIERWEKDRNQEENIDGMIFPFGFGDGGGGCTRVMLEQARRCKDLEGAPRCTYESPVAYFDRIDTDEVTEKYNGELHLAWHRGTYTTQARTKKGIRKAEVSLHDAEWFMSLLRFSDIENKEALVAGYIERITTLWDDMLFCTFHDIAPGSSIERVHKEAEDRLLKVRLGAEKITEEIKALLGGEDYIYNTTGFDRLLNGVEIPMLGRAKAVKGCEKSGFTEALTDGQAEGCLAFEEMEEGYYIENSAFAMMVDRLGRIVSFRRQEDDFEYVDGYWNEFLMFKDVNTCYDAWEIGSMYQNVPVELVEKAEVNAEMVGDEIIIHVLRKLNNSVLKQDIVVGKYAERVDFRTHIDWKERHKLLKVSFAGSVHSTESIEDSQFGYVKRPANRNKQSDKDRYEVTQQKYTVIADAGHGVAVLNDCKYGVSALDNDIRLTLLRAPLVPDMHADQREQEFVYSVYPFKGSFTESGVLEEAYDLNYPLVGKTGDTEQCSLEVENGLLSVSNPSVVIESVFPSDLKEKDVVLRIYESTGGHGKCFIKVPEKVTEVHETDMLLNELNVVELENSEIELDMKPFEIKTIVLSL